MDFAFYLMSVGGTGWNNGFTSHAPAGSGCYYFISGIGIVKVANIFYGAVFFIVQKNMDQFIVLCTTGTVFLTHFQEF